MHLIWEKCFPPSPAAPHESCRASLLGGRGRSERRSRCQSCAHQTLPALLKLRARRWHLCQGPGVTGPCGCGRMQGTTFGCRTGAGLSSTGAVESPGLLHRQSFEQGCSCSVKPNPLITLWRTPLEIILTFPFPPFSLLKPVFMQLHTLNSH